MLLLGHEGNENIERTFWIYKEVDNFSEQIKWSSHTLIHRHSSCPTTDLKLNLAQRLSFTNKDFWNTMRCIPCLLSVTAFELRQSGWAPVESTKPEKFVSWSFPEIAHQALLSSFVFI